MKKDTVELSFPEEISNFTIIFSDDPSYVDPWKSAEQCAQNFIQAIKDDQYILERVIEKRESL